MTTVKQIQILFMNIYGFDYSKLHIVFLFNSIHLWHNVGFINIQIFLMKFIWDKPVIKIPCRRIISHFAWTTFYLEEIWTKKNDNNSEWNKEYFVYSYKKAVHRCMFQTNFSDTRGFYNICVKNKFCY